MYRMSGVVVVIGYIFLIPSVLGMLVNACLFVAMSRSISTSPAGGMMGGAFLFLIFLSFVGGLLGWLLVMKKSVLKCTHCGAVVATS